MNIEINGQPFEIQQGADLHSVLQAYDAQMPYAIMVNQEFIPKSEHEKCVLAEGDKVEVVSAIQGG